MGRQESTTAAPATKEYEESLSKEGDLTADHELPILRDEGPEERERIPLRYRLIAFAMILMFSTGSSYAEAVLSPLKSTLRKELHINNAQYGTVASADNLINAILPIIGGIGIDYWGAT